MVLRWTAAAGMLDAERSVRRINGHGAGAPYIDPDEAERWHAPCIQCPTSY
jgi:hypothetical protein